VNNNGGENIPPGDKPVQGVTDPDGCKQACSDHVKCVGWTWTSGKCYIKSSVGCMTYDPAATSGYCRPWSGPPGCGGANFLMEADDVYCDPTQTDPLQFCPGEVACPNCGSNHCACPSAAYCDPTQTDPPQLCPGEKACPDCGSNRCACPALLAPAPAPAGSECSNNWEVNNNGGENIPPGDKPVQGVTDPDGCKQACSDHVKCVGWTWTSGKCYIKSSVGCMTYDPAATSGYCRPWSGPPGCGGQ